MPLIVIGGFALGKILQETGLGKRIGLTCVRCMGGSFTGTLIGITLAVSIVAPLVPAITGKAAIFCAIGISLCDALDFKAKGREATAVILTCCLAVASTKLCYLTGGADLVLGMGLLQKASGISSTWMEYAMHNFLPGMLYTFMSVGLVMLILPSKVDRQALRATLQTKYQELGPVTSEQKRAAILMLVTSPSCSLRTSCTASPPGWCSSASPCGLPPRRPASTAPSSARSTSRPSSSSWAA